MRRFIYFFLGSVSELVRIWYRNSVRVLAYHDVPDLVNFDKQITFLKRRYHVIDLSTLKDFISGKGDLPPYSLLVTFDDGDITVHKNGLLVLKKYKVPSVLFIITSLINSKTSFWWNRIENHFRAKGGSFDDAKRRVTEVKQMNNRQRLAYLNTLETFTMEQLDLNQLVDMERCDMMIANHTHTHPILSQCTKQEIELDILDSKDFFVNNSVGSFDVLAYPNGDFDMNVQKIMREAGINYAFLFDHKLNSRNIDSLKISRIRVNATDELAEFKVKVSGLHSFFVKGK